MLRYKERQLNASQGKVRTALESQLNKRRPTGKVQENKFSLFKCLGSLDQGGFFYFQIAGDFAKTESGTRVRYRVLPDTATCGILLIVTVALLTVLIGLLGGKVSSDLALTVLAVNVIMWGYSVWGVKDLGERFEILLDEAEQKPPAAKE